MNNATIRKPAESNPFSQISKKRILLTVLLSVVLLTALKSMFSIWTEFNAGILSLLITFGVISILMKKWEVSWNELGLRSPRSYKSFFLSLTLLTMATIAVALLSVFIAKHFFVKPDESLRFAHLAGNLPVTLWYIMLGWLVGGLVEELVYRAFFITALQRILGPHWIATAIAIVIPGLFWAARHVYFKGAYGAVFMFFSSLVFGACYVLSKRCLWPNVVLHGLINTFGFINRY
ncbi:CPBP family intramembrane metalloprotease [Alteromonas sediminis]|uniref:CPBP family intramembrane metalloprotease n=1 Tax=Alteromonas sediminis TaxID=2259342 RepID=A0A3N5Y0G4_9ALTE|nr:CPBP family intramembrane glutamic endopeptidase [Alteromonas sediminis]RPJ66363.1 CPBP family intramembrane metalloprotease [Alteromonas sediminis]